jgi:cytochrome P450
MTCTALNIAVSICFCTAADERWKAIRKAVAVSFSAQNIKRKFPMILDRVNEVVRRSAKLGPNASIDVVRAPAALHV